MASSVALLVAVVLSGCAAAGDEPAPADAAPAGSEAPTDTHTMPDGSVMSGEMHDEEMHDDESSAPAATGPSEAARMVCGGDVAADVVRILGLESTPEPSSSWSSPEFTCTYQLAEGPLLLTVHDATDAAAGREHFDARRTALAPVRELKGMYGLGLPAFETDDGRAAFIRDGKTLEVDATALPADLGPDGDLDQGDLAYAVATSVLACWVDHA